MAITAVPLKYIGSGPTANGERIADITSGPASKILQAYGTATLDGTSTSFTANFVDGTITPFGTWSGVPGNQTLTAAAPALASAWRIVSVNGTADTAAAATTAVVSAVSTTGLTITISAAGTAAQTLSFMVELVPYLS